jgi:cyanophycinase
MTGILALHGGAEFHPADDAFLRALLHAAAAGRGRRDDPQPLRAVMVTTASARYDPGATAAMGARAIADVADGLGLVVDVTEARAIDRASAADPEIVARIAAADLVHVPGGDPDVVLEVLGGSPALDAIRRAWRRGAAVAGASAGAMAFGRITWTPGGLRAGFGWAGDVLVVPHAAEGRMLEAIHQRSAIGEPRIALLGLAECTGVIGDGSGSWQVAGIGPAWWVPAGTRAAAARRSGETIQISVAA